MGELIFHVVGFITVNSKTLLKDIYFVLTGDIAMTCVTTARYFMSTAIIRIHSSNACIVIYSVHLKKRLLWPKEKIIVLSFLSVENLLQFILFFFFFYLWIKTGDYLKAQITKDWYHGQFGDILMYCNTCISSIPL